MSDSKIKFRIHGDNIVECDRCLDLLAQAFDAQVRFLSSDPFRPAFELTKGGKILFGIDLIPGHGRWQINLQKMFREHGAPLREATDVVVARVSDDGKTEMVVAALEFCSALPAGNNAWQRNGRALVCAVVGIPYLYFADVGGVELDGGRSVKASRFPNPIVPFSYLTASRAYRVICLPVYTPSPSSDEKIRADFTPSFGMEIGHRLVRAIIEGESQTQTESELTARALLAVEILSAGRKRADTLRGKEWSQFLDQSSAQEKAAWLERRNMPWTRKTSDKVRVSETFLKLVKLFEAASSLAVGASGIPICMIPQMNCAGLVKNIRRLYGGRLGNDFITWLASSNTPLIVVWITGFKPGGDDSRPDRGLVPLARMIFGNEARILSIVSGPGKIEMWRDFRRDPAKLASTNGLWEAVFNLSDAILADSATMRDGPHAILTKQSAVARRTLVAFPAVTSTDKFSEHDVDSALHLLFSHAGDQNVFEVMCNPPGGDWSGITLRNFVSSAEHRWTSLPRVSGIDGKRPDHVVQIDQQKDRTILVAIESKDTAGKIEERVGHRMKKFMRDLITIAPTIAKPHKGSWTPYSGEPLDLVSEVISAGAFCWESLVKLEDSLKRGELEAAFAFEFHSGEQASLLHVKTRANADFLVPIIRKAAENFGGRLKVQIH